MSGKIKILGICGSPRKGGNCEECTSEALEASRKIANIETEMITLANLKINNCSGCERCYHRGTKSKPCLDFDDDMIPLYSKVALADGYIFTSPVYCGTISGLMKAFIDRLLPFTTAYYFPSSKSEFKETLGFRPAGAIAVGGSRNDGIEGVIYYLYRSFLYHDIMPVSTQIIGGEAKASSLGGAVVTQNKPHIIRKDDASRLTVQILGRKVAILAKMLKPIRLKIEREITMAYFARA